MAFYLAAASTSPRMRSRSARASDKTLPEKQRRRPLGRDTDHPRCLACGLGRTGRDDLAEQEEPHRASRALLTGAVVAMRSPPQV